MYMFEKKSRMVRGGPPRSCRPHASAIGSDDDAGRRGGPTGGSAKGVSLSTTAKTNARNRPSTNTGIETPRLAMTIVPTSTGELRRSADEIAQRDADRRSMREEAGRRASARRSAGQSLRSSERPSTGRRRTSDTSVAQVAGREGRSRGRSRTVGDRLVEAVAVVERGAQLAVAFSPSAATHGSPGMTRASDEDEQRRPRAGPGC